MAIKIVVMDGDGSTITHDNQLPDSLKELILSKTSIKWMMATGRSMDLLKVTPIHQYLSDDIFHIVDGGSCLMYKNGRIQEREYLQPNEIDLLFSKLILELVNFLYYSPDGIRGFCYTTNNDVMSKLSNLIEQVTFTNEINQFRNWLSEFATGKILLNVTEEFDLSGLYYHQNENNFDFTTNGVNKGTAFVKMLDLLGVHAAETIFIFNDKNDLPIIEHEQLQDVIKIKVGNYLPMVNADYHVDTPYDVAGILRTLI